MDFGVLQFQPGELRQDIAVQVVDDGELETSETLVLSLVTGIGAYSPPTHSTTTVIILNHEGV